MHAIGQRVEMVGDAGFVDLTDPPLELRRIDADEMQEVTIPDRTAGDPVVHPDAFADQVGGGLHRTILAHIKIARGEVAQRKHRQCDVAFVTRLDPA
jgi:hypothetical protein